MSARLHSNGMFVIGGFTSPLSYSAGVWYHVEIRNVDWTGRTFEVWVNGAFVVEEALMSTTATTVDGLRIGVFPAVGATETAYWD